MVDDLLPPSPNWYCSQASDCSEDGLFAYSTRSAVFLLDLRTSPPCYVGCLAGQAGHSNRVTAVKFGHGTRGKHLCATAGDDYSVKVWDVIGRAVKTEHYFHKEVKVTTIQWCASQVHQGLLVSGDEKGTLILWNHVSGENREFVPEKRPIGSLASCPHDGDYIAVGYKIGLVLILDISGKGQIIHKLRGHDDEVHSICWSPALGENIRLLHKPKEVMETTQLEEGTSPEVPSEVPPSDSTAHLTFREHGCLLISGSRDRTIRVWNTTQGKAVLTLSLPPRGGVHRTRERGDEGSKARVWLGLCWPQNRPREFISSSYGGDVVLWNLSKPGKQKWEYFGSEDSSSHNRIVFNILNSCCQDMFITTSMDRQIICWNTKTLKSVWSIPTLGGFVYSLSTCPVDPGCVALGVGDNMIRVWNTSTTGKSYAVNVLWQGIKSKVTVLSWHPERDNCLAYGTDDGRIGIYNTFNQGKGPHLSSTFHKKTVYSLSWGPQCPAKEGVAIHCLYSCSGDGIIYQHDPSRLGEDATNLNSLIRSTNKITHMLPLHTDVSWRVDGRAVAVGNEDGSIDIFAAPNLLLLCTIQVHHKLINCLQWYPSNGQPGTSTQHTDQSGIVVGDDLNCSNQSGTRYWLASGSNEPQVQVHDLTSVLGEMEPVQMKAPITSSFRTLNGHTLRITALSWSPHGNGHLVSASYDNTAQVWDVLKGEPIANFRSHLGRLFSVAWSVMDPDVIFSGGEDFCLMKWRVSKTQHTKPPTHKRNTMMSRPGKGKPSSSKNKKKTKTLKDTSSEGSTPPRPSTPEVPAKHEGGTPSVPESHTRKEPPASGSSLAKSSDSDACDLQRLIEAKRLELQKVTVAVDSSEEKKKVIETKRSSEVDADKSDTVMNDREMGVAEGSDGPRVKDSELTSDFQSRDAPDAAVKKDGRRRKKQKSLFPLSRNQDNRGKLYHLEDCVALARHKYSSKETQLSAPLQPGVGDNVHLGLFADRRAAYAMFREEGRQHEEGGYPHQNLEMWKGNLAGVLSQATEHNQLNSFLVAMSPLGGYDVWMETTEAYARQLEINEDYTQAATYYLACNKIHKAIRVLQDNKLHREAVALASVRLSPFDQAFTDVYKAWASHLESEGNYGQAAKFYLTINQPADAIMLLARKSDIPFLSAALHVSCISGQSHLTNGLLVRFLHECLMAGDWLNAQGLLANHSSLMFGSLVATMHEIIVTTLTHQEFISEELFKEAGTNPWIQEQCQNKTQYTPLRDQHTFLEHLIHEWFQHCTLDLSDEGIVQGLYDAVAGIQQPNAQRVQTKQLLVELAFELTLGQLSIMVGGASKAVAHWLQAIVMCHSVGNMDIARGILSLILPKGNESIKQLIQECEGSTVKSTAAVTSLQAHFMFTELYHLWWGVGNQIGAGKLVMMGTSDTSSSIGMMESSSKAPSTSGVDEEVTYHQSQTDHQPTSIGTKFEPLLGCSGFLSGITVKQNEDAYHEMTESETRSSQKMAVVDSEQQRESLLGKLRLTSQLLLSEPHARLSSIKGRLQYIQIAVGRLVSQHCLEIHGEESLPQEPNKEVLLLQDPIEGTVSDKHRDPLDPVDKVPDDIRTSGDIPQGRTLTPNGGCEDAVVQQNLSQADVKGQTQSIFSDDGNDRSAAMDITSNGKIQKQESIIASELMTKNTNGLINDETEFSEDALKALQISSAVDKSSGDLLPRHWSELMADGQYTHPAVTCAVLLEEQGKLSQDLRELEGILGVNPSFPDAIESAMVMMGICRAARKKLELSETERNELLQLGENAARWGLKHSWLTRQKALFSKHLKDLEN